MVFAIVVIAAGVLWGLLARFRAGRDHPERYFGDAGRATSKSYEITPRTLRCAELAAAPRLDGTLADPCWATATRLDEFVMLGSLEPVAEGTEVLLGRRDDVLYVAFRLESTPGAKGSRETAATATAGTSADAEDDFAAALQLYFSPRLDHTEFLRIDIEEEGRTRLVTGNLLRGELPVDRRLESHEWKRGTSLPCEVTRQGSTWTGELAIPVSALGVEGHWPHAHWGFNVVRPAPPGATTTAGIAWQAATGESDVAPIEFGMLRFADSPLEVTELDFGQPVWGENQLGLSLTNGSDDPLSLRIAARVVLPIEEQVVAADTVDVQVPSGASQSVGLPYRLSWRGRWPIHAEYCQRLHLKITAAESDEPLYTASFPFGFDVGLIAEERYGEPSETENPPPDAADFVARKRAYLLGRLPRFERRRGQADDEFPLILAASDESVEFDLMQPGVMQAMADWLYDRYDNDLDRLLGAMFFVHQRTVTRHSRISHALNPLSVIRSGGGLDDDRVWALAGLLSLMKRGESDQPYRCTCLSTGGHVVCGVAAVAEPQGVDDYYVLDPDVGVFYLTKDNTQLATLGELRRDRELSTRMHFNNVRHGREFYFRNEQITSYDGEQRRLWPPSAPAR
ncbi:MAG: hypothetical protein DWQ31_11450 [Planctomycetota bacterium]|nr:MAG: hypothetical protein DWQ31_11450 [Planctomycetota bacterium]